MDALLDEMSSAQLTEWMAYARLEPFGAELVDIHSATANSMFHNANRKKDSEARSVQDFRLWKQIESAATAMDDTWNRLKSWALINRNTDE